MLKLKKSATARSQKKIGELFQAPYSSAERWRHRRHCAVHLGVNAAVVNKFVLHEWQSTKFKYMPFNLRFKSEQCRWFLECMSNITGKNILIYVIKHSLVSNHVKYLLKHTKFPWRVQPSFSDSYKVTRVKGNK